MGAQTSNDESSLTVGADGPVLLQDVQLIEKLAQFNREKIPERAIHAKGAGAYGYFRVYMPMSDYTSAAFLQNPEVKTPVFVRFSTAIGSKGSADTVRDIRGFAVKFYTSEGNYDLVGSHLPVFFIRDAIKFPELIYSLKPSPDTNLTDSGRFWDFISKTPEATHMITWLFSDRGTIKSYRHMEGYGVNTFIWTCTNGQKHLVKYHWKPLSGIKDITRQEAEFLAGFDPDAASRDLSDSLERGEVSEYELYVQLIPFEDQYKFNFDILDATKIWPEYKVPLILVGKMTLNRAPENYFEEVEQSAFSPVNLVPGIEFSNDKLLQGRIFAYSDAQRYRLGNNFHQIPVNQPKNQSDKKKAIKSVFQSLSETISGKIERKVISNTDDFEQAGEQYRSLGKRDQDHLVDNIIDNMMFIDDDIQKRVVGYFMEADRDFGSRVARGLDY